MATVGHEVATCGSGFTAGPPLNVGFSSVEIRDALRALCAEKSSAWKLYAWSAIGLGAAVMVGSAFMGANRSPGPASTSGPRPATPPATASTELSSAAAPTSTTSRMTAVPLKILTADVTGRRYVPVTTVSGWPRCQIWEESVTCEFSKMIVGKGNGITVRADGSSGWATGNMGRETFQSLDYATTYGALGWTVTETAEGTRFTHDSTGHGMLVTAQDAYPF